MHPEILSCQCDAKKNDSLKANSTTLILLQVNLLACKHTGKKIHPILYL